MRISIRTKKRRMLLVTGEDVAREEALEWIQLSGADLSVPTEESEVADSEDEEEWIPDEMTASGPRKPSSGFGFQTGRNSNIL